MNLAAIPGILPGILAFAGTLSVAFGKPALGAFLSDAGTAQSITLLVTAGLGLWAGFAKGVLGKSS